MTFYQTSPKGPEVTPSEDAFGVAQPINSLPEQQLISVLICWFYQVIEVEFTKFQ
jgi:hypothetical protein